MKLKQLREAAGLSQAELAAKVGVTQGFISHIEIGVRNPTLKLTKALARALGVKPSALIEEEDTPSKAAGE
ncbi:MAG: helix-turn-helix transcriptional regulator [Firmicutes bacterium]|nr:helix-turn-helix transcriptional regulator [Bacillota bacterium]